MLIAFDPTRMPRTMKIVAGFHSLDFGVLGPDSASRLKAFGTRERHNEGLATRGRCEPSFCSRAGVAKPLRGVVCSRAHCEKALSDCRNALEGAILTLTFWAQTAKAAWSS